MNVAEAKAVATRGGVPFAAFMRAAVILADEVERLEAQLERTRAELAEATVRLAEWDRMNTVLTGVLPLPREQMEPTPSREAGP